MVSCLKQGSKMTGFAHPWSSFPYMYNVRAPQKIRREEDGGQKQPGYQWVSYWRFRSRVQHCYLLAFSFSISLSFNMSTQSAGQLYPLRAWCRDTIKVPGSPVTMTTTWNIYECYWQSITCIIQFEVGFCHPKAFLIKTKHRSFTWETYK